MHPPRHIVLLQVRENTKRVDTTPRQVSRLHSICTNAATGANHVIPVVANDDAAELLLQVVVVVAALEDVFGVL